MEAVDRNAVDNSHSWTLDFFYRFYPIRVIHLIDLLMTNRRHTILY
jgi:hypothetical protein